MAKKNKNDEWEGRVLWAHIVRGRAFQHYPKPKNAFEKAQINTIVNTILVNEYDFTMQEAIAAEHEYYENGMDFLDDKKI